MAVVFGCSPFAVWLQSYGSANVWRLQTGCNYIYNNVYQTDVWRSVWRSYLVADRLQTYGSANVWRSVSGCSSFAVWLQTYGGRIWLQPGCSRMDLQTYGGRIWLQLLCSLVADVWRSVWRPVGINHARHPPGHG